MLNLIDSHMSFNMNFLLKLWLHLAFFFPCPSTVLYSCYCILGHETETSVLVVFPLAFI